MDGIVRSERYSYRGMNFVTPVLNDNAWETVVPDTLENVPRIVGAHVLWDQERFLSPHRPSTFWRVPPPSRSDVRILDLPVKAPGQMDATLPAACSQAGTFVRHAMSAAWSAHPDAFMNSYAYLTIDNSVTMPKRHQRNEGLHVDGFQGDRVGAALPADFSYVAWFGKSTPTMMFPYAFETRDLDRAKHDFFADFETQARNRGNRPILCKPNVMYGMSAFTVHAAGRNLSDVADHRTFLRLSFSVREFDRLGNAQNPFLDLRWDMVPRHNVIALGKVRELVHT